MFKMVNLEQTTLNKGCIKQFSVCINVYRVSLQTLHPCFHFEATISLNGSLQALQCCSFGHVINFRVENRAKLMQFVRSEKRKI